MNEFVTKSCRNLLSTVAIGASVLAGLSSDRAEAANFCSMIDLLLDEASRDFAGVVEPRQGSGGFDVTLKLGSASKCAARQLLSSKSYYCQWTFQYRDAKAYATFEKFDQDLQRCLGDRAVLTDDQNVNHPDFFDSRIFLLDQVKVTMSVKDKSAMGNTFVFVSVEPVNGT